MGGKRVALVGPTATGVTLPALSAWLISQRDTA